MLDKILASRGFANAERLSRFLRYVVTEKLNGQADKLKESVLGIEVFGRKPSYDPRMDAVVRTEAVKLRARLRDYYQTDGREDELIIDIPKGGYAPTFCAVGKRALPAEAVDFPGPSRRRLQLFPLFAGVSFVAMLAASPYVLPSIHAHAPAAQGLEVSSIAVLPFADLSPGHDQEYLCDGLTEQIGDALAKVDGLRVAARTSSFSFKNRQQDIRDIGKKLNVAAVMEGSVRKDGDRLRITVQLNSVADGYHLWSQTFERDSKNVFAVEDEVSRAVVTTLQPHSTGAPLSSAAGGI